MTQRSKVFPQNLPLDLVLAQKIAYDPAELVFGNILQEPESQEYAALNVAAKPKYIATNL